MILKPSFYLSDTEDVAKNLLGKVLNIRSSEGLLKARIVEVEAYLGVGDPACHTFENRRTQRTEAMYLEGGHSYVYLIYGMYHCLNFVTRTPAHPEAVLIRAVQPLPSADSPKKKDLRTNGPGKLCKHYGITREHNGLSMWKKSSLLYVSDDGFKVSPQDIVARPRIGVDYAGNAAEWPLRFYLKNNPFVSRK